MTVHRPLCPDGRAAFQVRGESPCPVRARPYVLAATILASAMAFIDGMVVTIALPTIQAEFDASFRALQWVVNAYTLMLGALILVGGALGDRVGRRRVFLFGVALFLAASVWCAVAPNAAVLIAGRGLQGVGAALLVPQSLAIIAASFPKDLRGRAIGTWAAASAITTALGPPLGGFLIDALSWRTAFWINLPLCAVVLWLTWRWVPESRDEESAGAVDLAGGALAVLGLGGLTYGLTQMAEPESDLMVNALALVVGVATLVAFVRNERRAANALMPPALFRSRQFTGANILTVCLYGALAGVMFLLPFELISRRGMTAAEVGLSLLPVGLVIGVLSRFAGAWADRVGPPPLLLAGTVIVAIACVGLAIGHDRFWLGVLLPMVVLSAGMGLVVSPLTTAVMNAVPEQRSGAASGVNNAASRLAGLFAIVLVGALATLVFASADPGVTIRFGQLPPFGDPTRAAAEQAFGTAYASAMWFAALWAAAATLVAFTLARRPGAASR